MITDKDMERFGGVIVRLFRALYPNGTTPEQLRADAPQHGWIRRVLEEINDE